MSFNCCLSRATTATINFCQLPDSVFKTNLAFVCLLMNIYWHGDCALIPNTGFHLTVGIIISNMTLKAYLGLNFQHIFAVVE